jgi:hypothetical protein
MKRQTLYGHRAVENIVAASQVPHSAAWSSGTAGSEFGAGAMDGEHA